MIDQKIVGHMRWGGSSLLVVQRSKLDVDFLETTKMHVDLPAEQQAIIEILVTSGRFSSAEEAITEGLRLLVSSERLTQQVQAGIDQADRGELVDHDTVFGQLRAMAAATQAASQQ